MRTFIKYLVVLIITVTLFYLWLLPLFSQDTIFINGEIISMNDNQVIYESVYIKDGFIIQIGLTEDLTFINGFPVPYLYR